MNVKQLQRIAREAHAAFIPFRGVLGVGYGIKRVGDHPSGETAITVYVEKKLPPDQVPQGQLIPHTFGGLPTDVEEVRFDRDADRLENGEPYEGRGIGMFLDWGKIHRLNMRQQKPGQPPTSGPTGPTGGTVEGPRDTLEDDEPAHDSPTPSVQGDLFIIEDDGTLVYTTALGEQIVDFVGAWAIFRNQFGDDYDFASFFLDDQDPAFPSLGNFSSTIYRDAADDGYGIGAVNNRATWSASTRLLRMACHSWYSLRTMLHEIGHQWLFYINYRNSAGGAEQLLLHEDWSPSWSAGQKWYHPGRWADNDRSCMDYDHDDWVEDAPGTYRKLAVADADFNFCPLDQYLMGLLQPDAVASSRADPPTTPVSGGDFQIINSPTSIGGGQYSSTPVEITAENIIWNEGARTPDHLNSQRVFHQAVIAITFNDAGAFIGDAETNRAAHGPNWRRATAGRSVIDTSLLRAPFDSLYIRDVPADTGGAFPGGAFWDSPDLFVRNDPDDPALYTNPAIDTATIHEDPRSDDDNWVYARVHNSSGTAYQNVTVNFYLANYHGFSGRDTVAEAVPRTEVIYPIDWHPEALLGSAVLASVPAGGTAVARVIWPQADIPDASWHPCLLAEIIPQGTSPNALHHVWDNKKLAQKNLHIEYVPEADHRFSVPVTVGHFLSPGALATVEIELARPQPGLALWLDPGEALGEVVQVAGQWVHVIPELGEGASEVIESGVRVEPVAPAVARGCGLVLTVPRRTTVGLSCGDCAHDAAPPIWVTFCDGARLLVRCGAERELGASLAPIEGFAIREEAGRRLLAMTDPQRARFPFWAAQGRAFDMQLRARVDGRQLERPLALHIKQLGAQQRVVGGVAVSLRPRR